MLRYKGKIPTWAVLALTAAWLALAGVAMAPAASLISDGGFENGPPPFSSWTVNEEGACDSIVMDGLDGLMPYNGTFMYWAGGFCDGIAAEGYASQTLTFPTDAGKLSLFLNTQRVGDNDLVGDDYFMVTFAGDTVFTMNLTSATDDKGWMQQTADISDYAGKTGELRLATNNSGSAYDFSHVFIDDVAVMVAEDNGTTNGTTNGTDYNATGWWWEEDMPGSAISVEDYGSQMFLAWYAYKNSAPWWYVSVMARQANGTFTGDLLEYSGWELGVEATALASSSAVGTISLTFDGMGNATQAYTIGGVAGSKQLKRWMPGQFPGAADPQGVNGWWRDPDYDNIGWFVESHGGAIYGAWFHYGQGGNPRWWGFGADDDGFPAGTTSWSGNLYEWAGGQEFGGAYAVPSPTAKAQVLLNFSGNSSATFQWNGTTFELERFILE